MAAVFQFDTEHGVWKLFYYFTFNLNNVCLAHESLLWLTYTVRW